MELEVRDLTADEIPTAGALAGRALSDSPTFRWASGEDVPARVAAALDLFVGFVGGLVGSQLGAFLGPHVVGVCGAAPPGTCIGATAPEGGVRAPTEIGPPGDSSRGLLLWSLLCGHDTEERHWHLGPVAVDPVLQGHGVGARMLTACCERMDAEGEAVWLETDKPGNVVFYRRHGFEVVEAVVLPETDNAFTTYFMHRPPR